MIRVMVPAALLAALSACGGAGGGPNFQSGAYALETGQQAAPGMVKSFLPQENVSRSGNAVHWVTPNGCAYSRTQAPGRAPVWYLIQNPHHLGMPKAHLDCAMTVPPV